MKFILCMMILFIIAESCNYTLNDQVQNFIPGTYIRFSQHEYGTEYDTLSISLQNKTSNEYQVMRKWKYERILDGERIEPEYKKQTTTCIYDSKDKLLEETETGANYSFDPKRSRLFAGSIEYKKIK